MYRSGRKTHLTCPCRSIRTVVGETVSPPVGECCGPMMSAAPPLPHRRPRRSSGAETFAASVRCRTHHPATRRQSVRPGRRTLRDAFRADPARPCRSLTNGRGRRRERWRGAAEFRARERGTVGPFGREVRKCLCRHHRAGIRRQARHVAQQEPPPKPANAPTSTAPCHARRSVGGQGRRPPGRRQRSPKPEHTTARPSDRHIAVPRTARDREMHTRLRAT